jgi:hypothetical protein
MMTQHVVKADRPSRPRHLPGEIVWVTLGNYLEERNATAKMRPVVILNACNGQHWVAGLTTQAHYATTGSHRIRVPKSPCCGLCGKASYLWGRRPTRVSRLDVRTHAGWADAALIDAIAAHMDVPWHVMERVRDSVAAHAD